MDKKQNTPVVINFLCGPGNLKSGISAGVFSLLKLHFVKCELVTEYAKDLTWQKDYTSLDNQELVFKEQAHRLKIVGNNVDVIVTDTSLLFSFIYGLIDKTEVFKDKILKEYYSYNNLNIFLNRNVDKKFETIGRKQNLLESIEIDRKVKDLLLSNSMKFIEIDSNEKAINKVTSIILGMLGQTLTFRIS